jgi:hypothetical protein
MAKRQKVLPVALKRIAAGYMDSIDNNNNSLINNSCLAIAKIDVVDVLSLLS